MNPDVNIYRHRHGYAVYYVSERAQSEQVRLRTIYTTPETWPDIVALVGLLRARGLQVSYTRAEDVSVN